MSWLKDDFKVMMKWFCGGGDSVLRWLCVLRWQCCGSEVVVLWFLDGGGEVILRCWWCGSVVVVAVRWF